MKIVNRQEIPQTNNMMDSMDVYKFSLGLFGLQIDLIGFYKELITAARVYRLHAASCYYYSERKPPSEVEFLYDC